MVVTAEPTLSDWVWIQACVSQAMLGVLTPEVRAVGLSRSEGEWVVTFFVMNRPSPEFERDLVEVGGDAESFVHGDLPDMPGTTDALHSPIRSVIIQATSKSIAAFQDQVDRLLFAQSPE